MGAAALTGVPGRPCWNLGQRHLRGSGLPGSRWPGTLAGPREFMGKCVALETRTELQDDCDSM